MDHASARPKSEGNRHKSRPALAVLPAARVTVCGSQSSSAYCRSSPPFHSLEIGSIVPHSREPPLKACWSGQLSIRPIYAIPLCQNMLK
ncbi:hypothetical protein BT69DRAFT_217512 [Atractiella rhizophila]|nr:hypothetical protein BT69DRAFT_217512 [Atractiella rhizophila]